MWNASTEGTARRAERRQRVEGAAKAGHVGLGRNITAEHDHAGDGQEEVYVVLRGSARLRVGDHETELVEGDLVRVGPDTVRKILPGDRGVTVLALGGTPGKVFESSLG